MDIESVVKGMRNIYHTLKGVSGVKVSITYVGLEAGITKPWIVSIESYRTESATAEGALLDMYNGLKSELITKTSSTEAEANRLKQFMATLDN
jgi:hypothetical protein